MGPPTWGTGPGLTIGQVCMSLILAAGLLIFVNRQSSIGVLVKFDQRAFHSDDAIGLQVEVAGSL